MTFEEFLSNTDVKDVLIKYEAYRYINFQDVFPGCTHLNRSYDGESFFLLDRTGIAMPLPYDTILGKLRALNRIQKVIIFGVDE